MTRTIRDDDLLLWEVYSMPGRWGEPDHAKLVFLCLTDPGRRARVLTREGDVSDVEGQVVNLAEPELRGLLGRAEELS